MRPCKMNSPSCRSHDAASIFCRGSTAASWIMIHAKIVSHLMGNGSSNTNGIIRVILCKVKEARQHFTCACPVHLWVNGVSGTSHYYMQKTSTEGIPAYEQVSYRPSWDIFSSWALGGIYPMYSLLARNIVLGISNYLPCLLLLTGTQSTWPSQEPSLLWYLGRAHLWNQPRKTMKWHWGTWEGKAGKCILQSTALHIHTVSGEYIFFSSIIKYRTL